MENKTQEYSVNDNQKPPVRHEINLDLNIFFRTLLANWKILLLCLIIGIVLGGVYKNVFVGNLYRADTNVVISDTGSVLSISDFSISSQLASDYIEIFTSRTTLKAVIRDLNLDMSPGQLAQLVSVVPKESSHIYNISATTSDPDASREIANSLMNIGMHRVQHLLIECQATVVDPATKASTVDVTPGYAKYVGIGGIIGLAIPILILLILHLMDATFKDDEDVETSTGLPILARIPYYRDKKNMISESLNYYEKEAFNTLYGAITLSGDNIKVISVTSASPNEGKTSLAYKLAEIMTEYGKNVFYIDCDMRNSIFCREYGIDRNEFPGLSAYLSGNASFQDIFIRESENPRLVKIPAGKNPPNPSVLISGEKFSEMVAYLKETSDYVVLDTPPVNAVIDGVYISKESDGTILVIDGAVTDRRLAVRALEDLKNSDANVLGVVMNKLGRKKTYGYGKRGYGYGRYGYGKHYGKGFEEGYGSVDTDITSEADNQKVEENTDDRIEENIDEKIKEILGDKTEEGLGEEIKEILEEKIEDKTE